MTPFRFLVHFALLPRPTNMFAFPFCFHVLTANVDFQRTSSYWKSLRHYYLAFLYRIDWQETLKSLDFKD